MGVTNKEVNNGVHPFHWATSSGPSPMGTDPINGFKMVQIWFQDQLQQWQNRIMAKAFKTPLLTVTNWTSKDKEDKV